MKTFQHLVALLAALACLAAPAVSAEGDPLVLRRQTLIVRDIERSLALYRDAIGMEVFYDEVIRRPRGEGQPDQEIRLIFLKATDTYIGVLGLVDFQHDDPDHPDHSKPIRREGMTPGNAVVLFNTTELEARWPRIVETPGVEVMRGPTLREYPGYAGQPPIRVMVTLFYDPDGFIVEFNQPLDAIRPADSN
ncbi:MAG: VOC family protein [Steroidobacteraceae bacterium]